MSRLFPLALFFFVLTGCAASTEQENSYRQISMDEAVSMMEKESDYIILDVRTPEEYSEKHISRTVSKNKRC